MVFLNVKFHTFKLLLTDTFFANKEIKWGNCYVKEKQNTWDHISKGDFAYCETVSKIEKTVWHRI